MPPDDAPPPTPRRPPRPPRPLPPAAGATLYLDLISQPCRALCALVRCARLPVTIIHVSLARKEHKTPAFVARFPLAKLPAFDDGAGLRLPESAAIARHLLATLAPPASPWRPPTPAAAAIADAALAWCGGELRPAAAGLVWAAVLARTAGAACDPAAADRAAASLRLALAALDSVWLAAGGGFVGGAPAPAYADVAILAELDQLALLPPAGANPNPNPKLALLPPAAPPATAADLLAAHPRVRAWAARVDAALGGARRDAARPLFRAVRKLGGAGWWPGGEPAGLRQEEEREEARL